MTSELLMCTSVHGTVGFVGMFRGSVCLVGIFETGFLCVSAPAVLELAL